MEKIELEKEKSLKNKEETGGEIVKGKVETEKKAVKNIKLFKYVGETERSGYERNLEHTRDREKGKISSHMLKHKIEHHKGEDESKVEFRRKI